jgi:prepilin-type N-terminal cleavage/methylation domain-containing protein
MNKAFTLVELAIVVVVLGILVGGVLTGQSIVNSAKRQSVISQLSNFEKAALAFKLEYDDLPGDIRKEDCDAYNWNTDCFNSNGSWNILNSNNRIESHNGDFPLDQLLGEPTYFFSHLYRANLVNDRFFRNTSAAYIVGEQFPELKDNSGGFIFYNNSSGSYWFLGITKSLDNHTSHNLSERHGYLHTPEDADWFDKKIDDGKPLRGTVTSSDITASGRPISRDARENECITTISENKYNISSDNKNCSLSIKNIIK